MRQASGAIRWDAVDPFLAGPHPQPANVGAIPFDIPATGSPGFRFGRIVSGAAWPTGLAAVDRPALVPAVAPDRLEPGGRDVVLSCEVLGARPIALCFRPDGAGVRWNVDPLAWIRGLLTEAYVTRWKRPLVSRIPLVNYTRMPHVLKGLLQGLQSPVATYPAGPMLFPALPLDDLTEILRALCFALAFGAPPAAPDVWPGGRRAAVTVTHDVDTHWILDARRAPLLREIVATESSLGYRGAWYITAAQLYAARHEKALQTISEAGHEIGAHGWNHDGKLDYLSVARQERRMERIHHRFAGRRIEGIRTPWYCRSEQLFGVLARHFAYDTSVPNASGFFSSGTNSGCCTVFPYRPREGIVELPMTLPPDSALSPADADETLWACATRIIALGGVIVITLHPQPHQSANRAGLARHYRFLERLVTAYGDRLWHATPKEIVNHYAVAIGQGRAAG